MWQRTSNPYLHSPTQEVLRKARRNCATQDDDHTGETMEQPHALPKKVRFDASIEESSDARPPISPISELTKKLEGLHIPSNDEADNESSGSDTLCDSEKPNDAGNIETQQSFTQNDEANTRLAHAEWLRKTSDNVYMSNRKSMN